MKIAKQKTISEMRAALAKPKQEAPAPSPTQADVKKTYITIPYYTPSDDVNIDEITESEKKAFIQKGKLMGTGDPITIAAIKTRQDALKAWHSPNDFTYDPGTCYKAWMYTWIYLTLTILSYAFIHPLLAVPFAWKVGHNWGQYIGGLIFGKEDMKGKIMYHTV